MRWTVRDVTSDSPVCVAAWGADDQWFTGHRDGTLWRRDASGQAFRIQGHDGEIVALAADEHGMVSAGADRRLLRWDSELKPVGELPIPNRDGVMVKRIALASNRVAALLAPLSAPSVLAIWSRLEGKGLSARRVSDGFATGLAFAPDDSFVASTSSDDHIVLSRDGAETRIAGRSEGPENFLVALSVPDPQTILCASRYWWIRRIDVLSGRTTHKLEYRSGVENALVRAMGDHVVVVTAGGRFGVWSLEARQLVGEYELPIANWTAIAANQSTTRVSATSRDATIIVELDLS